jgi:hypothetical protein
MEILDSHQPLANRIIGQTVWIDALTHATEHPTDAHVIMVELKK